MPVIQYQTQSINHSDDTSILDTLLEAGHRIPYSCRSGVCHSCLMICHEGEIPKAAQSGLKSAQLRQNYFLACSCKPQTDMHVSLPSQSQITTEAEVVEVQWLAKQVYRLMVTADISYIPGQYMTLWKDDQIGRSYSIASLPNKDNLIEFHIKHITNGAFSDWAHQLKPGQKIRIQGPIGECCYANDAPEAPMILIGTGTGLAPLYGILQDAISHGHQGKIYLFTGAFNTDTLYYIDELKKLETEWPQLDLQLCVLKDSDDRPDIVALDALDKVVLASDLPLKTAHIYLCGAPDIIEVLRKQLFLKGASFQRIHADIFVPSNP